MVEDDETPANGAMAVGPDTRAELLLQHYNDSFQQILFHWKGRNRSFIFVLIVLALLAVDTARPGSLSDVVNGYVANHMDDKQDPPRFDLTAVGSVFWFLLLCLVINYYQRSISVTRLYNYVAKLESDLSSLLQAAWITREGKSYFTRTGVVPEQASGESFTDCRPRILKRIGWLYTTLFPLLLILLVACRPLFEWYTLNLQLYWEPSDWKKVNYYFVFDVAISAIIIYYNILYIRWVQRRT